MHRSSHSDMGLLKKLLFEVAFEELKAGTEARYYAAREQALTPSRAAGAPEPAMADADDVR